MDTVDDEMVVRLMGDSVKILRAIARPGENETETLVRLVRNAYRWHLADKERGRP